MDSVLNRLVEFSADLRYEDLGGDVVHACKQRVTDYVGCVLGGYDSTPSAVARSMAMRALNLFVAACGTFAGNMALGALGALGALARGGVYVAGGIALKIIGRLKEGVFMRAFTLLLSGIPAQIPVRVVMDAKVGLGGGVAGGGAAQGAGRGQGAACGESLAAL